MSWITPVAGTAAIAISIGSVIYTTVNGRRIDKLNAKTAATVAETTEIIEQTAAVQAETRRILAERHQAAAGRLAADVADAGRGHGYPVRVIIGDPITEGDQTPGG